MAHFWGSLKGEFGKKVTNLGSKLSGLEASLNGSDFGVSVSLYNEGEEDKVDIYLTGGSNEKVTPVQIGTFTRKDLIKVVHGKKKN